MNAKPKTIEYAEVDSTNNEAKRRIASAAAGQMPFDYVIVARKQTGGRGRVGRAFFSPAGGSVYISFILRVPQDGTIGTGLAERVTVAAAVAVCETVEALTEERPRIKWVNDVLLESEGGRSPKKICGILTEAVAGRGENKDERALVLGIGININVPENEFPCELRGVAGSLNMPEGKRGEFISVLTERVFARTAEVGLPALMDAYRERVIHMPGERISINSPGAKPVPATYIGIADDGGLKVEYEDGTVETHRCGEVSIRVQNR